VGHAALESWAEPALELKDATILVLERLDCAEELLTGAEAPDEETRDLAVVSWIGDTAVVPWDRVLQSFVGRSVDALLGRTEGHVVDWLREECEPPEPNSVALQGPSGSSNLDHQRQMDHSTDFVVLQDTSAAAHTADNSHTAPDVAADMMNDVAAH